MLKATNWKNKYSTIIEIVSLSTPKGRVIAFSFLFSILALLPTRVLSNSPVKCIFKEYVLPFFYKGTCPTSGFFAYCNCPACGMTRGLSSILHGRFIDAWYFNKLSFVVFSIMIFIVMKDIIVLHKRKRSKQLNL